MSVKIIQLNEETVKVELKELVCKSAAETLNKLSENDAEELTCAGNTCEPDRKRVSAAEVLSEVAGTQMSHANMKQTGFRIAMIRKPVCLIG